MVVGIDLGTTNSAIGIWRDGRAQLIPNSLGSVLTPSAASVDDGGEFVIGILLTLPAGYPLPMTFATVIRICADIARSMRSLRTNSSQSANAGAQASCGRQGSRSIALHQEPQGPSRLTPERKVRNARSRSRRSQTRRSEPAVNRRKC